MPLHFHAARTCAALLLVAVAALGAGCGSRQESAAPDTAASAARPAQAWPAFADEFVASYFEANPPFAVTAGRHEFDGRLPDFTAGAIRGEAARLRALRERAVAYPDAQLDTKQRIERDYVVARIDNDLFWIEVAKLHEGNPSYYLGPLDPSVYVTREYAPLDVRARAFTKYLRSVAAAVPQIRGNFAAPLPRPYLKVGIAGFGGLADFYRKDAPAAFAAVADAQVQADLKAAIEPAAKALEEFAAWLKAQEATAIDAQPLGAERYAQMLRMTEGVDVPVAQVEAAGRADLERNLAALKDACAKFAPGASVEACVKRMKANKPQGGAVPAAREQLQELRAFVVAKDLVSIPGTEAALVEQAPPFKAQNFAFIEIPGPYEKNLPSIYYISPPDPSWSKAEQADYVPGRWDLMSTSAHEVWPGHFLQFLHSNRAESQIGRLFVGYAYAEGWAHYVEEMMIEKGWQSGTPEAHIGQLSKALLRNVRLLSSIGIHTQGMTVAQSEAMFRELAYQDAGNARQQAARGAYDPGYLNYTLGKLMIRKLRDDWAATRGGEAAWKRFHDEFLSYGGPPIPLVRKAMLGADAGPAL